MVGRDEATNQMKDFGEAKKVFQQLKLLSK